MMDAQPTYLPVRAAVQPVDAYTDLHGLQRLTTEKNDEVALQKVAKQFESMFVSLLFKNMRQANAVFEEGNMGHSPAEKMYRDLYDQQLSVDIAAGRGLGIADMVYRQLRSAGNTEQVSETLDNSALSDRRDWSSTVGADAQVRSVAVRDDISLNNPNIIASNAGLGETGASDEAPTGLSQVIALQKADAVEEAANAVDDSPQSFVERLYPIARVAAKTLGLDPLIMVAQAALETGWGKHVLRDSLGNSSHNLFNIKADSRWSGPKVTTQTLEYREGIAVQEFAKFRRYDSIENSVKDFVGFLASNPRYESALNTADDPQGFIEALQEAGYATDPKYANKVTSVYQKIQSWIDPNSAVDQER